MRRWVLGLGAGLAVSFPAVVVAQILAAVLDDDRPAWATVALATVVLLGPVVGAFVAGRPRGRAAVGVAIGAACLFVISGFGVLRQSVAGDDAAVWTVPALTVLGGVLGWIGDLAARAGRTRP